MEPVVFQDQEDMQNTCPHLGLKHDALTTISYPSSGNFCHYVSPAAIPALAHQRSFCLCPNFNDCPVFKMEPGQKMPKEIRFESPSKPISKKSIVRGVAVTFIIVFAIIGLAFANRWISTNNKAPYPTDSPALINNVNRTITQGEHQSLPPESELTQTAVISLTPEATDTPIVSTPTVARPPLSLGVPIGGEIKFLMHRVIEGETLLHFAERYRTSIEAIKAINYNLLDILWTDWVIIIPIEMTDVSDLPAFEPYEIVNENIKVSSLAEKLETSLELLSRYNNIPEDLILYPGDWVIVPREHSEHP